MAGSSVNSKGNSSSYHVENERNEHLNDRFAVTPANGSGYFDREMVKQAMLVHETTFQKHIYEVQRLQNIQKDLMAVQCQRKEFNVYSRFVDASQPRSYSSHAPSGDASRVRQVGLSSGHDIEQPYKKSMKGNGLEHSLNGVPSRHTNSRPTKRSLDLQLPASTDADDSDDDVVILWEKPPPVSTDAGDSDDDVVILSEKPPPASTDAGDSDDDVVILWEKPAKSLRRTNSSVRGGNVNLNLEGSSHMNSWISGLQPSHGSRVNVLNKEVGESSNSMQTTNFPYVGTSTRYSSAGVNLNPPSLQDNLKEKGVGESSGSQFFGGDKKMGRSNSYIHSREDQSNSMSWFKHKQSGVDFSKGHCVPSFSTCNPQVRAAPSSNAAFKSPWQSSMTNTPRSRYIDVEMPFAQNGFSMNSGCLPTLREYCRQYHPSKIHEKAQHQKHSASHDCLKDIDLNDDPRDITTTPEQGENKTMDIVRIRRRQPEMKKSQESSSCANGQPETLLDPTTHSEGSIRIFGFLISTATGKDSGCSSTLHIGTNSMSLIKGEANMFKSQIKKEETNVMSLIDLNVALPFMDDLEMDVRQSGGDTVLQEPDGSSNGGLDIEEPDGSSNGALDIGAVHNILPMCKEEFQAGSPQGIGDDSEAPSTQEKNRNEDYGPYAA